MDVVIFELGGQYFALPAANISEVFDPLPVTPLPFAPEYVDGLVNLAGRVSVQMDAATRLGMGERLASDKGNVLAVAADGALHAVHVRRVIAKVSVPDEDINQYGASQEDRNAAGGEASLAAIGEFEWAGTPVLLLEAKAFTLEGLTASGVPDGGEGLLASVHWRAADEADEARGGGFPCVIVEANRERYAFRLADVGEIVEAAELTALPHAPREVAGMALLRGMPLLALSLGVMLGGEGDAGQSAMVVVESGGVRYGLLAERVVGIQRFASGSLQAVDQGSDLEGYLVGARGAMIGLLDVAGLLSAEREAVYRRYLVASREGDAVRRQTGEALPVKRMLAFRLGGERGALPLEWVERVEEYQEETLLPSAEGSSLSGVVQIYGEVAPVVDLRREMGFPSGDNAQAAFLVVRKGGGIFALAVDRVEGVVSLHDKDIEPIKAAAADYVGAVGRLDGGLLSIFRLDPLERRMAAA